MNQLIRMLEAREKRQMQMLEQTKLELKQAREVAAKQHEAALENHDAAAAASKARGPGR